jgi:hypothetical protein
VLLALAGALLTACSGGGGGGGATSGVVPGAEDPPIGTVLASSAVTPALGGFLTIEDEDASLDGAYLDIPAHSVSAPVTVSVGPPDALPPANALGQEPVGSAFVFEPKGTTFAVPATLSLPVPQGDAAQELYLGRWNSQTAEWDDLGGAIEGDFFVVEVEHLSLYGLFYKGKSLVSVANDSANPIELRWISGPLPPEDWDQLTAFPAYSPFEHNLLDLNAGQTRSMQLLPGAYHFAVSYPTPNPGITNSLFLEIPELEAGADDGGVDQVLRISRDGATSSDAFTDDSIQFAGAHDVPGSNQRPRVNLNAFVPVGVPVVDGNTGGPVTGTTRVVNVGPIVVNQIVPGAVELRGTARDPEGHTPLHVCWTWSYGTLPTHHFILNETTDIVYFLPNPKKAGTYTIYFTAYDQFGLFDEGRFNIVVRGNTKPYVKVIADDFIIDFGRLDAFRRPLGATTSPLVMPLHTYVDTTGDGLTDTTYVKTLPVLGPVSNPTQDPTSMTIVWAIIADADGDPLTGGYKLPTPIFGRGTVYATIPVPGTAQVPDGLVVGQIIDSYEEMDLYNAQLTLLANAGALPVDTTIFPDEPAGAQALPILWEAPDDPDTPSDTTNDCSEFGPCGLANGGTVNVVARFTDGWSTQQTDYTTIGFPDEVQHWQLQSVTPNPPDPGPGQGVTIIACVWPQIEGVPIYFLIVGSDGYTKSETNYTDASGCADFFIPGGAEGVVDTVTVESGGSTVIVTYEF